MKVLRRRNLVVGGIALLSTGTLMGCNVKQAQNAGNDILTSAEASLETLFAIAPESRDIYNKSAGTLIMPRITKASFVVGGSYGEGVLKIGGAPVDFHLEGESWLQCCHGECEEVDS